MESITNKRPALNKQYLVVFILAKLVDQLLNCSLVPQNNAGEQKRYPFVTYNFVDLHRDTTADHKADQFDCTIQIEVHHNNQFQSMGMAEKLRNAIVSSSEYRRFFTQAYVVPHEPQTSSDIQDHTVSLFGINYDYTFGFDYDFQVSHADITWDDKDLKFVNEGNPTITSVEIVNNLDGRAIETDKKEET